MSPYGILVVIGSVMFLIGVAVMTFTEGKEALSYAMPLIVLGIPIVLVPTFFKIRKATRNW